MQKMNGHPRSRQAETFIKNYSENKPKMYKVLDSIVRDEFAKGKFFDQEKDMSPLVMSIDDAGIMYEAERPTHNGYLSEVLLKGKMWRPLSLLNTYAGFDGNNLPEAIKIAAAIELEHVNSTIVDDVIDQDKYRHDLKTVWYHYASELYKQSRMEAVRDYKSKISELKSGHRELMKILDGNEQAVQSQKQNYKRIRRELDQELSSRLSSYWSDAVKKGGDKANLFSQYLTSLIREVVWTAKFPSQKLEEIVKRIEAAHIKLVNGENHELNLRENAKKQGLDIAKEDDYWEISKAKACLFDLANDIGFKLAVNSGSELSKFDRFVVENEIVKLPNKKSAEYVNEQATLIKRSSELQEMMLQLTDDAMADSEVSGKEPWRDIPNGVPTLHAIKTYQKLKELAKENVSAAEDLKYFRSVFGNSRASKEESMRVFKIIRDYGVDKDIEGYMSKYLDELEEVNEKLDMTQESKDYAMGAVELMVSRSR